jgi:hypothetical protein
MRYLASEKLEMIPNPLLKERTDIFQWRSLQRWAPIVHSPSASASSANTLHGPEAARHLRRSPVVREERLGGRFSAIWPHGGVGKSARIRAHKSRSSQRRRSPKL